MTQSTKLNIRRVEINGYSLKGFTPHHDMSQETLAFSAKLLHEGEQVGEVSNSGRGEAIRVDADHSHRVALSKSSGYSFDLDDQDIEMDVSDALVQVGETAKMLGERGKVGMVLDADLRYAMGAQVSITTVTTKKDLASVLAAVQHVMDLRNADRAIFPITGVLHIATR